MNFSKPFLTAALPLIAMSNVASAANYNKCEPEPAAPCNQDDCVRCYCLGPENTAINPPVRPRTCDGDVFIDVAGFYWNAHQEGLEYAIRTKVDPNDADERSTLIDADFINPDFKWDFGFKLGIGYNSPCDGWDIGILWTRYNGRGSSHDEADDNENSTLLLLFSDYINNPVTTANSIYANDIKTNWNLDLDLVDVELGREFWNSKYLTIRPHIGLRFARLNQDFDLEFKGDYFVDSVLGAVNDSLDLRNDFNGVGVRGGLDTVWNFGCGWALYGNLAVSIVYGRFNIEQDEVIREVEAPFTKRKIMQVENNFRASRLATDLALGLQWSTLFCDCKYGFKIALGWEHHLFLNQNQLWRINRHKFGPGSLNASNGINNVYKQGRGDLDTQGWTLSVRFDF